MSGNYRDLEIGRRLRQLAAGVISYFTPRSHLTFGDGFTFQDRPEFDDTLVTVTGGGGGGGTTPLTVATYTDLRAIALADLTPGAMYTVQADPTRGPWVWSNTGANLTVDDAKTVVKRTGQLNSSNGRFYNTQGAAVLPNYAAMRAASGGKHETFTVLGRLVAGDGGGGTFHDVTATEPSIVDNDGTIFAAGSRRFRREYTGPADARWFGAKLTNTTDGSVDSFTAIQTALDECGDVFLPAPADQTIWYWCSDTITVEGRRVSLSGPASSGVWDSYCVIKFPAGKNGIVVTEDAEPGSRLCNFRVRGPGPTTGAYAQGITIRKRTDMSNVEALEFTGVGIEVWGAGGDSNCNSCHFDHVRTVNCGWLRDDDHPKGSDGIYVHGNDSNACSFVACRGASSGRYNIHDNSFLGNTWVMPESDGAGQAKDPGDLATGYYIEGDVNATRIFGIYSESEAMFLGPCAKVYGGSTPTNYLVPGSTGALDGDAIGYGLNLRLVTQSRSVPGTKHLKATYAPSDDTTDPALFYWIDPDIDPGASRFFGFFQRSYSVSKSGMFFGRFQIGQDDANAFGISDAGCYRGDGLAIIPTAYYLGNSSTTLKRHWQATDRSDAHLLTLEQGDSYLYTTPTAGGAIGEIVTRSGKYANPRINSHAYSVNDLITLATDNGHYYKATSIGSAPHQTAGSPPVFNTGSGSTTTDGDITWTEQGTSALFTEYGYVGTGAGPAGPAGPAGSIERRKDAISGATSYGFAGSSPTTTLTVNHTIISMTASGDQNVTFKRTGATDGSIVEVAFYTGAEDSVTFFDETRGDIGTLGGSTNDITTPFYASFVFLDSTDGWVPLNKGNLT